MSEKSQVAIIMGSDSDWPVMEEAAKNVAQSPKYANRVLGFSFYNIRELKPDLAREISILR